MREIDFLPDWYATTHRKRKLLKLQFYCVIVVALALSTWAITDAQALDRRESLLISRTAELEASTYRVRERQEQERLRAQYQMQQRVGASLGLNVESSRVLKLLEDALPKEASLLEVVMETSERQIPLSQRAAAVKSGKRVVEVDRQLNVRFKGVAPTSADIATMLDNLRDTGFCNDLALDFARDHVEGDYLMHEFAIRFSIEIDSNGGAK